MRILIFLTSFFLALNSMAAIWISQNSWNEEWEKKYSSWIENEVSPSYLKDLKISTDCADAVLALRWIFARQNSLPMISSTANGKSISNLASQWDRFETATDWKNDRRFLNAIKSIHDATDTKTLFRDLYSVKLSPKFLTPGALYVNATETSGHAEWIAKTFFDGLHSPIVFYSSTVPQQVREFLVYPFMKVKWPKKNANGFMKFRWAVVTKGGVQLAAAEKMPGYSLEQYELGLSSDQDFDDYLATRFMGQPLDGLQKLKVFVSHLAERIENRIQVVIEGARVCGGLKCPDLNSSAFYNHSTYSRDGEIQILIQGIFELIYANRNYAIDEQMAGNMTLRWSQLQSEINFDILGRKLSLGQIVQNFNLAKCSSDPNQSIEKRWGF
jgi:hypothetical protein